MRNTEKPYDAGDPKDVQKAIKAFKSTEEERREVVALFMSTPGGRKWFHGLLLKARVYENPFSRDALVMAFNCGEKNIGLQVLEEVTNADQKLYALMLQENEGEKKTPDGEKK